MKIMLACNLLIPETSEHDSYLDDSLLTLERTSDKTLKFEVKGKAPYHQDVTFMVDLPEIISALGLYTSKV